MGKYIQFEAHPSLSLNLTLLAHVHLWHICVNDVYIVFHLLCWASVQEATKNPYHIQHKGISYSRNHSHGMLNSYAINQSINLRECINRNTLKPYGLWVFIDCSCVSEWNTSIYVIPSAFHCQIPALKPVFHKQSAVDYDANVSVFTLFI